MPPEERDRSKDEAEPQRERIDVAEAARAVQLDVWANFMIEMAEKARIPTDQPNCKAVLSKAQRHTILELEIEDEVRGKLTVDATGPRTFTFTAKQLASICQALAAPLAEAQGKYRNQLLKAAEKVAQGITDGLSSTNKPPRKPRKQKTAFQLLVTLREVKPIVWRRFQVMDCTLPELHSVLKLVLGWQRSDFFCFEVGDTAYSSPPLTREMDFADGSRIKLSHLVKQGQKKFCYLYDAEDKWEHVVETESAFHPEDDAQFPICLEGASSCPSEGVGGVSGHESFLRAINDPEHPEHETCLEICGGWFDPEAFDLEMVNRALAKMASGR